MKFLHFEPKYIYIYNFLEKLWKNGLRKVKTKFIKARILSIASKHKDLSPNQKRLIAEIAAMF